MVELTNDMIISDLNVIKQSNNMTVILLGIVIIILLVFVVKKYKKDEKSRVFSIICGVIILVVLGIPTYNRFCLASAIEYSLENSLWELEIDKIVKLEKIDIYARNKNTNYYVYMERNGKIEVPREGYENLPENESAYIVIVKGRFGGKYPTRLIYHASAFEYNEMIEDKN